MTESVKPHLEQGEEVRAIFQGQSLLSPIWYLPLAVAGLVPLLVVGCIKRRRTMVVTNQNVYQFSMRPWSGREVNQALQKVPLGEATADFGSTWSLEVGEGPRLYATFDSGRGVREEVAALINQANTIASS